VQLKDFIKKASVEGLEYVTDVDYNNEKILIFFEDGSRAEFDFDKWFYLYETAMHIISINTDLSLPDDDSSDPDNCSNSPDCSN